MKKRSDMNNAKNEGNTEEQSKKESNNDEKMNRI